MKSSIFAVLGLAAAMSLFSPSQARAGVVIGVGVGPVCARPVHGYVVANPRPYGYYAPAYPVYGRFYGGGAWGYRNWDHRGYAGPRYFRR